jgi:hypothetical protein
MRIFLESAVDRIELGTSSSSDFVHGEKSSGFGVSSKIPKLTRGAGDGAAYRGTRSDTRVMDLDVSFFAADRLASEVLFRRLTSIVLPRVGWALPRVVAEYADGTAVESEFVYQSGLEGDGSSRETWGRFLISVECPNPFWVARDALQFAVSTSDDGTEPFLDNMSGLPVSPSNAIGSLSIVLGSDVGADLTVIIVGPSSGATTVLVNGEGYSFGSPLADGETVTVTRGLLGVTVVDGTGANRYADLGSSPKFPQLSPGVNQVDVTMVGATSDSRISGNYKPRFEGVY